MNNNEFAIESFISFCDDMMIAEEGFKDGVKNIGKTILKGITFIWNKFLELCRRVKSIVKTFFTKNKKSKNELIKEKDAEIAKLKAQLKESEELADSAEKLAKSTNDALNQERSSKEELVNKTTKLEERIAELEEEKKKLMNRQSSDDKMNTQLRMADNVFHNFISYSDPMYLKKLIDALENDLKNISKGVPILQHREFFSPYASKFSEKRDKYSEYFEDFKRSLQTAYTNPDGRIQEAFILTKLKIIDNYAAELNKVKLSLESYTKKAETIKDEKTKQIFLANTQMVFKLWCRYIESLTALQSVFYELLSATDWTDRNPRSQGLNEEDKFTKSKFEYFTPMSSYDIEKLNK